MTVTPSDLSAPTHTSSFREPEIVELSLLVPRWQVEALESAARSRGLSTAQMIRRCLSDTLAALAVDAPLNCVQPTRCF